MDRDQIAGVMDQLRRSAEFIELLGVEDPTLSMSEWVQDRARRCGMMPIHPARRTVSVLGPAATDAFGPPGAYGLETRR